MYAWSNFATEISEHGQVLKTIKCGEKISQDDLGVSDADWKEMIDSGAVREEPYPENLPPHVSPWELERSKIDPKENTFGELRLSGYTETSPEDASPSAMDKALGLG